MNELNKLRDPELGKCGERGVPKNVTLEETSHNSGDRMQDAKDGIQETEGRRNLS